MNTFSFMMIPVFLLAMGLGAQLFTNGNVQQNGSKTAPYVLGKLPATENRNLEKYGIYTPVERRKN
jgi:hypothetical protein